MPRVPGQHSQGVLRQLLPDGVQVSHWNYESRCNFVARAHFEPLVAGLQRYFGAVRVRMQFRDVEKCTEKCQEANPETFWNCTCVCGGLHHGGGEGWRGWTPVGDHLLVSSGEPYWQEFKLP